MDEKLQQQPGMVIDDLGDGDEDGGDGDGDLIEHKASSCFGHDGEAFEVSS